MDCGLVRAMTPVPKPRAIASIAGAIPVVVRLGRDQGGPDQRARAAALGERERERSVTAPRAAGAEYRSHGPSRPVWRSASTACTGLRACLAQDGDDPVDLRL
jgi:hypothetical protein